MIMVLNTLQEKLFNFVKEKHKDQKRKYTDEPYHNHLFNVAQLVSKYEKDCIEIALCHDLFEDTNCSVVELYNKMKDIGYSTLNAYSVCRNAFQLTDVFIKKDYPFLNRKERKTKECQRLANISYKAKCVKYADLIDNTEGIVKHDVHFAKVYLKEKEEILKVMTNGNKNLFDLCNSVLFNSLDCLQQNE